jgi:hypothetical protein
MESAEFGQSLAGAQNIAELEAEVSDNPTSSSIGLSANSDGKTVILYEGSRKTSDHENPYAEDLYDITSKDIETLMADGFTVQEIFEADDMGNELDVDPKELLSMKKETGRSLKELKEEILQERKDDCLNYLKNKYSKGYAKLKSEKLGQDEILMILEYIDSNNIQVTDDLIKEYRNKGKDLFREAKKSSLSEGLKKKYGITDKEAVKLSDDLIRWFETISKKTDKPVKELIKEYIMNKK